MNKFTILLALVALTQTPLLSQKDISNLKGFELHNRVRLNVIPVTMPTEEFPQLDNTMGLVGLHYQVPINTWLYGGAAFHFATTGDQGGLFTLGVELGINRKLYDNLYLDANLHFGGGGGYRYLVNDGGFVNSNIGLQYKKEHYAFGLQYSYIDFYSGKIKSNGISFFVDIPSVLRFSNYDQSQKKYIRTNTTPDNFWRTPATKNTQQVRFDFFIPTGNSKKDNGSPLTETLYVIGFEYQKYLSEHTFLFAHTDAIYKGLRAGFMDLFIGAGYVPYQSKYFNVFTKLGIGAAGGRIAPEGGLTLYPSAGIDLNITKSVALSGHGGYYRALDGDFEAYTIGFGLKYFGLNGGTETTNGTDNTYDVQGLSVLVQNQSYFGVAKTTFDSNTPSVDLQLLAIQVRYDLNAHLYLTGEAGFAYDGKSGGYANGLVGIGAKSNTFLDNKLYAFLDLMAGAGGGAGVDTGEGIVVRPTVGLNYNINKNIALMASGGQFISPFGNVDATNINIGLSFNFGTLSAK